MPGYVILYAVLSAVTYATLLPLWEGYDESYHYAYLQHLDLTRTLPVLDKTQVRQEIWDSTMLVPSSGLLARRNPTFTSYARFLALPAEERSRRNTALRALRPGFEGGAGGDNYEAQQPPLAYLALLPVHRLVANWPLYPRIWVLRTFASVVSVLLLAYIATALGREMCIPPAYRDAAVFCLFSTQSVYGAVAHMANDWLSLPLIPTLFLMVGRFWRSPSSATTIAAALALAAGLLAKAYFLLFVPFVFGVIVWRSWRHLWILIAIVSALAAPWYARNLILYESLTGLQSVVRAVPQSGIWAAALATSWPGALAGIARAGLWSGNNSFTAYSAATLNVALLLIACGWGLWIRSGRRSAEHWIVVAGTVLFAAIPIYAILLVGALSGQVQPGATSWYTVGMLPGVLLIGYAGLSVAPRFGRWIARAFIVLSAYIVAATYFAKLIPLYAGFDGPARLELLRLLYCSRFDELLNRLGQTAMASGEVVVMMAASVAVFSGFLSWRLFRQV